MNSYRGARIGSPKLSKKRNGNAILNAGVGRRAARQSVFCIFIPARMGAIRPISGGCSDIPGRLTRLDS
jgi:hypothetical protein